MFPVRKMHKLLIVFFLIKVIDISCVLLALKLIVGKAFGGLTRPGHAGNFARSP